MLRTPPPVSGWSRTLKHLREALSTKLHQQAWPILKAMVRDGRVDGLSPWPAKYKSTDQVTLQNNEAGRDDLVANVIADAPTPLSHRAKGAELVDVVKFAHLDDGDGWVVLQTGGNLSINQRLQRGCLAGAFL